MIHNVYAICNNLLDLPPAYSELQKKYCIKLNKFLFVSIHANKSFDSCSLTWKYMLEQCRFTCLPFREENIYNLLQKEMCNTSKDLPDTTHIFSRDTF